ncbi:MAG: glycosyltransferase [Planctomycetaceae bacterium]|nr:glycosyltransferase [Planctomycetaceae bacterium]
MRILFSSYAYPNPWQPGLGTFNRTMLAGLAQQHAVRVIAPVAFTERWRKSGIADFQALPNVPAEYPTYYYPPKLGRSHYDKFLWWSTRSTVRARLREFAPDVVLSYWAHPDGAVAVRAAHEAGIPAIVMVGGSDVLLLARSGSRRQAILKTLAEADAVIAVSQHLQDTLIRDGLPAETISVIGRGVDTSVFHPGDRVAARQELGVPQDRPVIVGVGRLVAVKDWITWLEACEQLVARGLNPASYVCGAGPLAAELRHWIDQRGLTDFIELRGSQSPQQLATWYRAADLTLLTSLSEGIPNVLLESMACGGSFVATAVGGIPEITDPIYDRLAPAKNATAIAEAIVDRLHHTPPTGYQRRFEPSSQTTTTQRLTELLNRVCGHRTNHTVRTENSDAIPCAFEDAAIRC